MWAGEMGQQVQVLAATHEGLCDSGDPMMKRTGYSDLHLGVCGRHTLTHINNIFIFRKGSHYVQAGRLDWD